MPKKLKDYMYQNMEFTNKEKRMTSRIKEIDDVLPHILNSEITFISGESVDASDFLQTISLNLAENGLIYYVSLKHKGETFLQKLISNYTNIDLRKWGSIKFTEEDTKRFLMGMSHLSELPTFYVSDQANLDYDDILTHAKQIKETFPHQKLIIFIDHMGLILPSSLAIAMNQVDHNINLARKLKHMARELNASLLVNVPNGFSVKSQHIKDFGDCFIQINKLEDGIDEAVRDNLRTISVSYSSFIHSFDIVYIPDYGKYISLERQVLDEEYISTNQNDDDPSTLN